MYMGEFKLQFTSKSVHPVQISLLYIKGQESRSHHENLGKLISNFYISNTAHGSNFIDVYQRTRKEVTSFNKRAMVALRSLTCI
jgi:hypothetical protein